MNPAANLSPRLNVRRRSLLSMLLGSAAIAHGCGGGGGLLAGISSGGTGSFTSGTIVGFGSVIVNGVRYDDSAASVLEVDGSARGTGGSLGLGMVVAVQGGETMAVTSGLGYSAEAVADRIVVLTELQGPVDTVDTGTSRLVVLGQTVQVGATTVVDGQASRLADIRAGDPITVYGHFDDSAGLWLATRLDVDDSLPSSYRLAGTVSQLSSDRRSLLVGGQPVVIDGAQPDAAIVDGVRVRAVLDPVRQGGTWRATSIRRAALGATPGIAFSDADIDGHEAELEGVITAVDGTRFVLEGVDVDGSALAGSGLLVAGARVEVKGRFDGTTLVASSIEADGEDEREQRGFELHGVVSQLTASTFVLRSLTIGYDPGTPGASALAEGRLVEVKVTLLPDGRWQAVEIEAEDESED